MHKAASHHLELHPAVAPPQHVHGRHALLAIAVPEARVMKGDEDDVIGALEPIPYECYCLLALLPCELAVLHLFKKLLLRFRARKEHANAAINVSFGGVAQGRGGGSFA